MDVGTCVQYRFRSGWETATVVLGTDRLVLREFTVDDAIALHAFESIPGIAENIGMGPLTLAETDAFVAHIIEWQHEDPRRHIGLAITVGDDYTLMGRCGLERTGHEPGEAVLWYSLHPHLWGRGLMTEAVTALVGYGFAEMGVHRVWADVDPGNIASWRVMEKVGLRREGLLRENAFIGNRWCDSYIYAMLEREWNESDIRHSSDPV